MVTALLDIPPGRLWAEIDADEKGDRGKEGGTKFKPPGDPSNSLQRQIGAKAQEDTEGDPHLPTHNETTPNRSRDVFGGKDRDCRRLGAHTNPEQQTADEKLFPGLAEAGTDDGEKTEDGAEEDGTATADEVIERIGKPAAAMGQTSAKAALESDTQNIQESGGNVGSSVDQTDEPVVLIIVGGSGHGKNAELGGERQVCAVRTSLVPTPTKAYGRDLSDRRQFFLKRASSTHCTAAPTEQRITVKYNKRGWDHLCVISRWRAILSSSLSSSIVSKEGGS